MNGLERPPIHVLLTSETGGGKSTMAATFPKPSNVHFFDPHGKDFPYLKGAQDVGELIESPFSKYRDVIHADGVIRLEYFHDVEPTNPIAYALWLQRMAVFHKEYTTWRTLIVDSLTFCELAARKWHQYILNPNVKDPRQWYGGSKELLEEMFMMRLSALPMNVVVCTHVDEDKDELHGEIVRNPAAPGKLAKRLGSAFGEHYWLLITRDERGNRVHMLQTRNDGLRAAATQIDAPNPTLPHYDALWGNWERR